MKHFYLLTLLIFGLPLGSIAQTPCDQGRFYTEVFPNVTTTPDIQFGANNNFVGNPVNLFMDIYEPTGDTMSARPLIIWAHGGSFIGGSRTDGDVVALSNAFAKRGFVCASIDYRVGMWPIDSVNAVKAVVRAVQDMKAATRYFYMDSETSNTYKIDTTRIIIAGSSAGAITALHYAYLDKPCEVEAYISSSELNALGGLDGNSGNPGYSSNVHGVINLAGALASYGWLEAGDVPFCSMQGDDDGVVPYNHGVASVSGFNVITMDGSRVINAQANAVGVQNNFYTHYDAGHAVYATNAQYMDTTIKFVTDFVVDFMGCSETILQSENAPTGSADLYQLTYCGLGTNEIKPQMQVLVYPNPATSSVTIELSDAATSILLTDLSGRRLRTIEPNGSKIQLERNNLAAGTYLLTIVDQTGNSTSQQIIFE